jgi:hypothetical protein
VVLDVEGANRIFCTYGLSSSSLHPYQGW